MPDEIDGNGMAKREGFLDNYPEMSLWVSVHAKPFIALSARSKAKYVKNICGTGKVPPQPTQMYQSGFRVAAVLGSDILEAITEAKGKLTIVRDEGGNEIDDRGHLNLRGGQEFCDVWAQKCRILTNKETFD
jgi:hypothetical protein